MPPDMLHSPDQSASRSASRSREGLSRRERLVLFIHRELDHRLSPFGVWLMRRTKGSITARFKVDALVLTTTGRRSGKARDVVLQSFPDGDAWIVVATNDGGPTHPAWYLNLVAGGPARVEAGGRKFDVSVTELAGDEADRWWHTILARSPDYERYTLLAKRRFPIIRLTPAGPAAKA
jgi:deazaflavin-dependent oxidoreductase (nitroreductase family)